MTLPTPMPEPAPGWLAEHNFIPAPSDPALLTLADVRAAFGGDWSALKDVVKVAKEVTRAQNAESVLMTD